MSKVSIVIDWPKSGTSCCTALILQCITLFWLVLLHLHLLLSDLLKSTIMPYVNIKETCFDEETMSYALIMGVSSSSSSSCYP